MEVGGNWVRYKLDLGLGTAWRDRNTFLSLYSKKEDNHSGLKDHEIRELISAVSEYLFHGIFKKSSFPTCIRSLVRYPVMKYLEDNNLRIDNKEVSV